MNILKLQDGLKNLSDEQLAQEMRLPSGSTPQYLIMTEMQRREKMRAEFSGSEPPKTTMAEEMSGEAPSPQGGMPPGGQDANAQGLMGISGQPQQIDGMTALPPQAMAVGGAVQFGNPFAGAQMGSAPSSTGYAPIQRYTYTAPPPPPAPDYTSMLRGLGFNPRGTARPAKPPVVQKPPVGTAVPVRGRPAQNRGPIRRASDGGPIYMFDGQEVPGLPDLPVLGGPETSDYEDWRLSGGAPNLDAIRMMPPKQAKAAIEALQKKSRIVPFSAPGNPNLESEYRDILAREYKRAEVQEKLGAVDTPLFGSVFTPKGQVDRKAQEIAALEAERGRLGRYTPPSPYSPAMTASERANRAAERGFSPPSSQQGQTAAPDAAAPETPAQFDPGANAPELPLGGLMPPSTDYASLNMPTDRSAAPPSASVSGLPSLPNLRPSGGGIASLPKPEKDSSYEDYMKQANALLAEAGGDPAADKDRSFNNALMKLGLGMAASKNQSILGAAAEGGIPALEQYTSDEAQRRKDARAMAGDKLAVLGAGTQMRQSAEKDYRDQINKAEELRQRGMESEAKMLEAEATAKFRMAELGIRGSELVSAREERDLTRAYQDRVLQATIDNNKATLEKDPEAVRTLKAEYGDKWTLALEAETLRDNLGKYRDLAQTNLNAAEIEKGRQFTGLAEAAAKRLEEVMKKLYGSDSSNTGTQIRRVDANGNPIQ